jgi:Flp pilus assembly protein TadB
MVRIICGVVAVLVAVWVVFAVLRALGSLFHLALVVAIVLVAYSFFNSLRNRGNQID